MNDLEYLERLKKDLIIMLESQKSETLSDQILVSTILSNVREIFVSDILTHREQNKELAIYLESLATRIIKSITQIKSDYDTQRVKTAARIELLEKIIEKSEKEKEAVLNKIISEKDGQEEREKRSIRTIGERPKSAKEKREKSEINTKIESSKEDNSESTTDS
jgi:hypothetical protein